jgi:hypothetical protein
VLDVHDKPGHAGQSLRDPVAGVGALFHGVGTTGLDDPLAPLQVSLNLLRQAGGHLLKAIDQLGRQLMARDPALLRAIAMVAPTFELGVPCFQPAPLAAEAEEALEMIGEGAARAAVPVCRGLGMHEGGELVVS